MTGIELSRSFYEQYGKPMLETDFADIMPLLAVGFVGSGSERFGFDDEISRDHDYEAGFSIFLPNEEKLDRRAAFLLERAYNKLPKEFMGVKRPLVSPVGGSRNGPVRIADFYGAKVGSESGDLSVMQWLTIPDNALFEATNGAVFYDGSGEFTAIREKLKNMPDDIRKKRLAGNLLVMAQAGQYNFMRCVERGEYEAAQLACGEFVNAAFKVLFLLGGRYAPYYKWAFHALREFEDAETVSLVSDILLGGLNEYADAERKYDETELLCSKVIEKLKEQELTKAICGDLEKHAYSVNDGILDGEIRNYSIFISV